MCSVLVDINIQKAAKDLALENFFMIPCSICNTAPEADAVTVQMLAMIQVYYTCWNEKVDYFCRAWRKYNV